MSLTATIFDIQHFSLHDGPGVRSTVFFKGCPLSCFWCSNPESQHMFPEVLYYRSQCKQCGACLAACPEGLLHVEDGRVKRAQGCKACGQCTAACRYGAQILSGRKMSVSEVCDEVHQHWRIFMQSGGGVTCSGGEPMAQLPFLFELLKTLHENIGLNTCIETCGFSSWENYQKILPYIDELYMDIKHMDSTMHQRGTGRGNEIILSNIRNMAQAGKDVTIRVPLIPSFNDTDENLEQLAGFMRGNGLRRVEFMPMHVYGRSKYEALGRTLDVDESRPPRTEVAVACLEAAGIEAAVQHL